MKTKLLISFLLLAIVCFFGINSAFCSSAQQAGKAVAQQAAKQAGKININTADVSQLEKLPGVGPKTAKGIAEYRKAHGKFKSIEEIKNVKGIGDKKFEKIKGLITVE